MRWHLAGWDILGPVLGLLAGCYIGPPAVAPVEAMAQVPPNPFPPEYDPARLGDSLAAGESWRSFEFGSAHLIAWGRKRPREWAYGPPPPALAQIVPDPVFGRVYRFIQPADSARRANSWPGTVQLIQHLPPGLSRIWARVVLKVDSDNKGGFTSRGTLTPGGSTTYKMLFLRSQDGKQRHEFELYNGGDFLLMGSTKPGNNVEGERSVRLAQGRAPVPPVRRGSERREGNQPLAGWLNAADNGGNFLTARDWFEFVINYEFVAGSVLQRFFIRRLTVDGIWKPAAHPAWVGWQTTGTTSRDYTELWLGANKSQSNDGPGHQYVFVGPWEVTSKADPYGWDGYGRP